ncbi:peptidoglycan DD-metalloendopeptidase family protein [Actinocorallia sp. API 0066]|uniref:peptidoglycan DD-metalloendopeptidase family protein n=1 Tax=Actinocorallia sp. API 0066 TaxID=2896846 RepID=UPI001E62FA5D|nr:peptidoglycan DD-metalloendopeptidase family protein [Actinocorallia sp. API 0066]MCD0448024.1 peptidoglycan DD-metalloendopeptidase family protein [Actinocorallia sp. API 0066]
MAFLPGLFERSRLLILDFARIPAAAEPHEDISRFFADHEDAALPHQRQRFNDRLIAASGFRYLVGRHGEDRSALLSGSPMAEEGRVVHLGVDVFCTELEPVHAPCDGTVLRAGFEEQHRGYGYYLVFQPDSPSLPGFFLGHLSAEPPTIGWVRGGERIARIGDRASGENGGWSRHLHVQALAAPFPEGTPPGYSTVAGFPAACALHPDPMSFFPAWRLR